MRNFLAAVGVGALLTMSATPGSAADVDVIAKAPPYVPFSWTMIYAGAFIGGVWGEKEWTEIVGPFPGRQVRHDLKGEIAGIQIGGNYQVGMFVFGVEGEFGWTTAKASGDCIVGPPFICTADMRWLTTGAARFGLAWDRMLFFGKAGGAWTKDEYHATRNGANLNTGVSNRTGWMLGAGVEYAVWGNWSVKLEYNYVDFGTKQIRFTDGAVEDIKQDFSTFKFGVSYRVPPPILFPKY
jgi:outer membrane immunogenic protein